MENRDCLGLVSAALWGVAWAFALAYVVMVLTPQ